MGYVPCDRQLRRWYRAANERWFAGALPDDTDLLYARCEGCSAIADRDASEAFFIQINPAYAIDRRMVQLTLLHEMTHIALWPYKRHGNRFEAEMLRLAKAGAMKGKW